jgi:hypothetical protein
LVRRKGVDLIIEVARELNTANFDALLDLLEAAAEHSVHANTKEAAAKGIASLFSSTFMHLPASRPHRIYTILVKFAMSHSDNAVRKICLSCLAHVCRANCKHQMLWVDAQTRTSFFLFCAHHACAKIGAVIPVQRHVDALVLCVERQEDQELCANAMVSLQIMLQNHWIMHDVDIDRFCTSICKSVVARAVTKATLSDNSSELNIIEYELLLLMATGYSQRMTVVCQQVVTRCLVHGLSMVLKVLDSGGSGKWIQSSMQTANCNPAHLLTMLCGLSLCILVAPSVMRSHIPDLLGQLELICLHQRREDLVVAALQFMQDLVMCVDVVLAEQEYDQVFDLLAAMIARSTRDDMPRHCSLSLFGCLARSLTSLSRVQRSRIVRRLMGRLDVGTIRPQDDRSAVWLASVDLLVSFSKQFTSQNCFEPKSELLNVSEQGSWVYDNMLITVCILQSGAAAVVVRRVTGTSRWTVQPQKMSKLQPSCYENEVSHSRMTRSNSFPRSRDEILAGCSSDDRHNGLAREFHVSDSSPEEDSQVESAASPHDVLLQLFSLSTHQVGYPQFLKVQDGEGLQRAFSVLDRTAGLETHKVAKLL